MTKVKLNGVKDDFTEQAQQYIQRDIRPNSRFKLFLYNLANAKGGRYRTERVRNVGEAPRILDSTLVEISRNQIEKFLNSKGYFNAEVSSSVAISKKKATVKFDVKQGGAFSIRNITYVVPDTVLLALYENEKGSQQTLREGMRYDADSLVNERENTYNIFRRNGYYDYLRQYVRFDVDSSLHSSQADLVMYIDNPPEQDKHVVFYIDSSFVNIRDSRETFGDSTFKRMPQPKGVVFNDFSKRIRARPLARYIYNTQGEKFDVSKENLTYDRLYELNIFRGVKISYEKKDSTKLNVNYDITPMKRMGNRVEGEYTFASGRNGFNLGNTYTNRNLFGGAEQLEIKARYGVLFDSRLSGALWNRIWNRDLQVGATLTIPRIIVPFNIPVMGKNGMPHTVFASNLQVFDQVNTYSNRYITNSITYNWYETRYKLHGLTPILVEYRDGRLDPGFLQYLTGEGYELYVRTNNRAYFGLGSQYSYTVNTLRLNSYENFWFFRGMADVSGNSLALLSRLFSFRVDEDGERTVFNVPYLQYAKVELDLRRYMHLGAERQFVARINAGVGVPYGNNQEFLIFEKSFFAGGMNDMRAWQARTLGPGNYNRSILSDSLRLNLRNLDQLGDIKIVGNFEYRFKLLNDFFGAKLKGAAFSDIGNIWRLKEEETTGDPAVFKWDRFLGQMAIGAGTGLRFDLDYFVFRFDVGFKIKDPQFTGRKQWVITELFNSREFKREYALTNAPDPYNFVQYNFGIGMPF
ncbi:BamA/TamA family outer membrane protein [Olivibacter sitiensis]|uniref:translocation and assembly module lipoprotein TamL n=1 Tax=Olivibacter sitiensis TaxID=376470 RepID=UPI000416A4E2|nr:BamA/TamA family outer membrane protein [Olivibacter sitiensis]